MGYEIQFFLFSALFRVYWLNQGFDIMPLQQQIWNSAVSDQRDDNKNAEHYDVQEQTIGFSVKNAVLFPPEVEKGRWPEDYSLSDHARLTVVFSPIRMPCSQMIC